MTPTFRDVNKKFSTRYYLNLVLIDEENRRYFKQQVNDFNALVTIPPADMAPQEITVFRIPEVGPSGCSRKNLTPCLELNLSILYLLYPDLFRVARDNSTRPQSGTRTDGNKLQGASLSSSGCFLATVALSMVIQLEPSHSVQVRHAV